MSNDEYNDFVIAPEEIEQKTIIGLLDIYIIYYNNKHNTSGNLFKNIDPKNKHSTNERIMELIEHISIYKSSKDCDITDYITNDSNYYVELKNVKYYCKLLVPLILYLSSNDWTNCEWNLREILKE